MSSLSVQNSPLFNKAMGGRLPSPGPGYSHSPNSPSLDFRRLGELPAGQVNIEEIYGTARKPRNFKQWEDLSRENTLRLREHGSSSPLVWVFVRGKDIPHNAIVAGEERRQPLYIARTFYEGGLCIGKAGRHLERGASFAYNGLEVHVDAYEVLVPTLHQVRYTISPNASVPSIPRLMADALTVKRPASHQSVPHILTPAVKGTERLNTIKTVILVDDSASMAGSLWSDAREALAGITDLNGQVSTEGVDVYFMNDGRFVLNCKDGNEIKRLFSTVQPIGETPTGRKLQDLFDRYLPLIETPNRLQRPICLVVITDGVPTDEPADVIVAAARRLDMHAIPLKRFSIHFVQIGNDPEATEALRELDDDLSRVYNIRDMVSTTPFSPMNSHFTRETLVQVLVAVTTEELAPLVTPGNTEGPNLLY